MKNETFFVKINMEVKFVCKINKKKTWSQEIGTVLFIKLRTVLYFKWRVKIALHVI